MAVAKLGVRLKSAKLAEPSMMAMPLIRIGSGLPAGASLALGSTGWGHQVVDVGGQVFADDEAQ